MKNTIILFLLLFLPFAAICKDKKPKPFPRIRWREVVRMTPDSAKLAYTDTMFLFFYAKDSFSYHYKNGFIYIGAYLFSEDSILDFGTANYRLWLMKPGKEMLLSNAKGIYRFVPDSADTVKTIVIAKEEKILPVNDIDQMIGHWTVYKKLSEPGDVPDVGFQVRSAYITGPSTDGKLGYIYGGNDADNDPSWYIKSFGSGQTLDCGGKKSRTFKVIKCQNGEMIIEEDGMKYFFKQFK